MKSHLIPEPRPLERTYHETDAAQFYLLDRAQSNGKSNSGAQDDFHPAPEMPMRNFLRVVFVH